jgi:3-deoxy-D-manno-octulosonate 8-phosphate phosphatase (KDO 8-P phosphatase)
MTKEHRTRLKKIKLLATDVDGVLTDAGMYYSDNGDEMKKFNTRDGMGMTLLREQGIKVAIITREDSHIVERRAMKLKITDVFQGSRDKVVSMEVLLKRHNLQWDEAAYIGDDVNDLGVLKRVGFSAAPADAAVQNKSVVHYITKKKGGEGCVRELCDMLLEVNHAAIVP